MKLRCLHLRQSSGLPRAVLSTLTDNNSPKSPADIFHITYYWVLLTKDTQVLVVETFCYTIYILLLSQNVMAINSPQLDKQSPILSDTVVSAILA